MVRGVLSKDEVGLLNQGIDAQAELNVRSGKLRNTRNNSRMSAPGNRKDVGNFMNWPKYGAAFRKLLCHPGVVPHLNALCGPGYRLDHAPLMLVQEPDSEGFMLHGGPLSGERFNSELQYRSVNGRLWNTLVAMSVQLVDAPATSGGFCVVRGSHKSNFPLPPGWEHGDDEEFFKEHVHQPNTKAGDVIFFSEATVHGAVPWVAQHQRRVMLYRFSPATVAYGRAWLDNFGLDEDSLAACTPAERAVLQPPFADRFILPYTRSQPSPSLPTSCPCPKVGPRAFDR